MADFEEKYKEQLIYGLEHELIRIYDEDELELFRNTYYGGLPASVLLLTNSFTNGLCYDRATLLAKALINTRDVNVLYGSIEWLRNKLNEGDDPMRADHCFVETIDKDGKHLIYDTSEGFVYDKDYYWLMEEPVIRHINDKETTLKFIKEEERLHPDTLHDKITAILCLLPLIETLYDRSSEMYAKLGMLQEEVELYKNELMKDPDIDDELKSLLKKVIKIK